MVCTVKACHNFYIQQMKSASVLLSEGELLHNLATQNFLLMPTQFQYYIPTPFLHNKDAKIYK